MERIAGRPLLRVMLERAVSVADGPVLCALPDANHPRASCLDGLTVTPVVVADAAEGMGASIRAGIKALPDKAAGVMILPADLPELTAEDLATMLTAWREQPKAILRAVDLDGQSGHPVIFPASLFPALGQSRGDTGARDVLHAHGDKVVRVSLPDRHATTDLDTPEDWANWRARR